MARCGKAIRKISAKLEETVLVGEWQVLWTIILNIDMTVTIHIKIKAVTNVTNVVISVIPWMINVVNGLRFLTLGFFL